MQVELRKLKINDKLSEETTCFSAEVWADGVRVAEASNRGHGGSNDYRVLDKPKWQAFEAWVKAMPPIPADPEKGYPALTMDVDLYLGEVMEKAEQSAFVKRQCRTKTLFLLKGDDEKKGYRTVKAKFSPEVKKLLVGKYGDQLDRILNEAN